MGRYSTGAITTKEATRIELSYLLKKGLIKRGCDITSSLSWTNGSSIGFESCYYSGDPYIRLNYNNTNSYTGEVTSHDYRIYLTTVTSNLGKGEVLYFLCPITGRRCRILYKCYGSLIWKSREAYQNRIYYQTQLDPKSMRPFKALFMDRKFEELYKKKRKSHYRGKPTRIMRRINDLERKHDLALLRYDDFERYLSI